MSRFSKLTLILSLACLLLTALVLPAAADAIVSPVDYVVYSPLGPILAGILIAAAVLVTVLLICRFFGNKKK